MEGVYTLEQRITRNDEIGRWFEIWRSADGAETARLLKQNVEMDNGYDDTHGVTREFRMRFIPLHNGKETT